MVPRPRPACRAAHSDSVIHIRGRVRPRRNTCKSAILRGMILTPDDLPNDAETLKAMILAARAEAAVLRSDKERIDAERARLAHEGEVLGAEVDRLTAQNERLDHIVSVLRRAQFGRRSEKISDDQIELALEDVETAFDAEDAATEEAEPIAGGKGPRRGGRTAAICRSTSHVRRW